MGRYHWLRELPEGSLSLERPPELCLPHSDTPPLCEIDPEVLEGIAEYQWSTPTSPSAGRIYRRRYKEFTAVFLVINDPDYGDGTSQAHIMYKVVDPKAKDDRQAKMWEAIEAAGYTVVGTGRHGNTPYFYAEAK